MSDRKQTFTPEFRAEAVRLAQTSGRSRREVAADLGVGLSTLRNWIDGRREREMDHPPAERQEDMAAELKRLRREAGALKEGVADLVLKNRLLKKTRTAKLAVW